MAQDKVKFRRIRGRVVPIRSKRKEDSTNYVKAGGLTAVGGWATKKASLKAVIPTAFDKRLRPNRKERDFLNKLGKERKITATTGSQSQIIRAGGKTHVIEAGPSAHLTQRRVYLAGSPNKYIGFHEMGHILASDRKVSFNRLAKYMQKTIMGKGNVVDFDKASRFKKTKMLAFGLTRPWTDLGAEAEANIEALRIAKKTGGWKSVRKGLRTLAPAYGTYVGRAALWTGGVMIGYGAVKRAITKRKNKK